MLKTIRIFLLLILFAYAQSSWAILHLMLTQGVNSAIPIAVVPFAGPTNSVNVSAIVGADLQNSGRFKNITSTDPTQQPHSATEMQTQYWKQQQVDYVVMGSVQAMPGDQYQVQFSVVDLYNAQAATQGQAQAASVILQQAFTVSSEALPALAHHISDLIYQQILGVPGIFSTKIAYVLVKRPAERAPGYQLMIADYNGANATPVIVSGQPIMSPSWSPDGTQLAYVSFESGFPAIYVSNILTGKRRLITDFTGINSAPVFSPDGQQLAVVLSRADGMQIALVNLQNGQLQTLTKISAINTEPAWSADGSSLFFTSDRGGSPQIYQLNLQTKQIKRITFGGSYNAHASVSTSDKQNIVVLHRGNDTGNRFGIALQNLVSGALTVLTNDNAQSPSVAPNGSMVVYAIQSAPGQSELAQVSTDGNVHLRLPTSEGAVQSPAWSPYLKAVF